MNKFLKYIITILIITIVTVIGYFTFFDMKYRNNPVEIVNYSDEKITFCFDDLENEIDLTKMLNEECMLSGKVSPNKSKKMRDTPMSPFATFYLIKDNQIFFYCETNWDDKHINNIKFIIDKDNGIYNATDNPNNIKPNLGAITLQAYKDGSRSFSINNKRVFSNCHTY